MAGFIEGVDRGQLSLLPESLDQWVDDSNPVRVIEAFVEALDGFQAEQRRAWVDCGGVEISTEGDSFFVVFWTAEAAVRAAVQAQRAAESQAWQQRESELKQLVRQQGEDLVTSAAAATCQKQELDSLKAAHDYMRIIQSALCARIRELTSHQDAAGSLTSAGPSL